MKKTSKKQKITRDWFLLREAAELSGLSPAMLDYLCRSRVLVPSRDECPGRGNPRKYLFGDLVMLRALARLLDCGISVAKLKTALHRLRHSHEDITESKLPGQLLITDGVSLFFKSREQVVEDLQTGQLTFQFMIELEQLHGDTVRDVDSFRRRTKTA